MKNSYPIILIPDEPGYLVYVPDFDVNTEGRTLTEAIEMAKDAIELCGVVYEDEKRLIPKPSPLSSIKTNKNEITVLVDVDFAEYRKQLENRSVKKIGTLP